MQKIIKRDGRVVPFDVEKITEAIWKAAKAVGGQDQSMAKEASQEIITSLEKTFEKSHYPTVEQIQDLVEKILIEKGHAKTAKAYILYRHKRTEERRLQEKLIGSPTKIPLSLEGLETFEKEFHETPEDLFKKTAHALSKNKKEEDLFYNLLANLEFLPHPHILKNINPENPTCLFHEFIIPTEEKTLFENLEQAAQLIKTGASLSINLNETNKPASLLKLFQNAAELNGQNQKHLALISKNHPELLDVLTLKQDEKSHFKVLQTDETLLFPESRLPGKIYEPIALGWINLKAVKIENLTKVADKAALFLTRIFEKSTYPSAIIQEKSESKQISLGLMGLAEVLYNEGIGYNSYGAGVFLQNILGKLEKIPENFTSNPLIANLFDTTNGIEPFSKQSHLEKIAIKHGFYSPKLMTAIEKAGSFKPFDKEIPSNIREIIFTNKDIVSKEPCPLIEVQREHRPLQEKSLRKAKKWVTK